ncbi:MAG TPA: Gfo/Idh/MocA family oxidoreductase [Tepidisphaeraceae bacterium]
MSELKCALIGYGAWGQHHGRALKSIPGVDLAAISAKSSESRNKAAVDHPAARTYADYRQLLEIEKPQLCSIVLPSHLHFEVTRAALDAGSHVLLEKPMALTLEHCTQLKDLAKSQNRILAIGHELRMSSLWGKVKEIIESNVIGDPLYVLIELWRRPYRLGADGWRYDLARVGDWILEEPIHFFDLARWYFAAAGDPVSVYAVARGKRANQPDLHDNFSAIVNFPNGKYAVISQTLAGWEHHQTVKITGTNGALWASWSGAMDRTFEPTFSLKLQTGEQLETVPLDRPSGEVYELVDEVAAVVKSVREGSPPPCTAEDGWWSTAMCLKASQSLQSGKPISLRKE